MTDMIAAAVENPFGWIEDDADAAVIEWQRQANDKTVAELAASPNAARVAAAVNATFEDLFAATAPERFGDTWFRKVQIEGRANLVLTVSSSPTGAGRVLIDPSDHGPAATIAICHPSHDGRLLFVGISEDHAIAYRVLNVADGSVVREFPSIAGYALGAWAHDNSGFFYSVLAMKTLADGQVAPQYDVWWQPLSGEAELQPTELDFPFGWPVVSADGRWVAVMANQTAPRPRWIKRIDGGEWTRVLAEDAGPAGSMYKGRFVGDEFWAITDDRSGWCRLVAIPADSFDDPSSWRELIAARDEIKLVSLTLCGEHVALTTIEGGVMRLKSLDRQGRDRGYLPLPGDGAFGLMGFGFIAAIMSDVVGADGDGCVFIHSSLTSGCGVYRADLGTLTVAELEPSVHPLSDRELECLSATGPNGPVTYWVLRKRSTPLDGSAPTIVTGYGGFNAPWIPSYSAMGAAWTELGGLWVHTQLRGGGERDTQFWNEGRMHRKQGTFDDMFAVIEDLHARGFATPERTGVTGSSNGGLLTCAVFTQRPDLIGAAVAQVPVCDLVNLARDPVPLNIVKADYGDPAIAEDAAAMRAYSPVHRVRAGTPYPALLCDAGAADTTCPPWHARKMVAAVEAANSSDRRIRLRVREGTGHNAMTRELFIERDVEELIFLYDELA
ncbi:prolyl oligopeptidase family serine peptidase [Sphingopyxis sp. J-6]|uniref:prolyl oligopeptidase family serine peptidase n=1 Tax=Sphingopyxis sp. J-6 TaxID=3122054 RepID=UPI0039843DD4